MWVWLLLESGEDDKALAVLIMSCLQGSYGLLRKRSRLSAGLVNSEEVTCIAHGMSVVCVAHQHAHLHTLPTQSISNSSITNVGY